MRALLIGVDPWISYADYPEYDGKQDFIYQNFLLNLEHAGPGLKERTAIHRGFSDAVLPGLPGTAPKASALTTCTTSLLPSPLPSPPSPLHPPPVHPPLPKPDAAYDLVYVDANHEPEYVLEDAVFAFRKLRDGGYLIFDDYGWGGPDLTARGIDAFLDGYYKRVTIIYNPNAGRGWS